MQTKIIDFNTDNEKPLALALGFFDCIHKGHESLVRAAIDFSKKNNISSALLTFSNDPNLFFEKEKQIYSFDDRVDVLNKMGVDYVISTKFDIQFANLRPEEFLSILTKNFNIKSLFVGADYTFGAAAKGDVNMLWTFCKDNDIQLFILPFEEVDGEKLSTRNLKSLVKGGNVAMLNKYLSEPYFMRGTILHERHQGTDIGFPTANIKPNTDRLPLKDGIYATYCIIDGMQYMSMTNVGAKPTFGDNSISVETYIMDFNKDVYGKEIEIVFVEKMREIIKFVDKQQLIEQLRCDEENARRILRKR